MHYIYILLICTYCHYGCHMLVLKAFVFVRIRIAGTNITIVIDITQVREIGCMPITVGYLCSQ